MTSIAVRGLTYLLTRNLPLAIILGPLAPAAGPAGMIAVLGDLRARGHAGMSSAVTSPSWEILGELGLGGVIGIAASYCMKRIHFSSDNIFVVTATAVVL